MEAKVKQQTKNYIFGKRNVSEYVQKHLNDKIAPTEWNVKEFLFKKNPSKDIIHEIIEKIPKGIKITYLSLGDLDSLLPGVNHQGTVGVKYIRGESFSYLDFSDFKEYFQTTRGPVLILDRIQDPGNLGNILRTSECMGFPNVVLSERESSPITDVVEKISSGAVHYLKIFKVTNLFQVVEFLKENGYWIVATSDRGSEDWTKIPNADQVALIIGNEGEGVKKLLIDNSDFTLRIPLKGNISSLNAGVAAAISMDRIINKRS